MALKPALFYTLKRSWWAGGFEIMRVTTEKTSTLHGSLEPDNVPTHVKTRDTVGRFPSIGAAEEAMKRVQIVRAGYEGIVKRTGDLRSLAERMAREAVDRAAIGQEPVDPPTLAQLDAYLSGGHLAIPS